MATVHICLDENDRICNAFGDQLVYGARIIGSEIKRNNRICLSTQAINWLGIEKTDVPISISVKDFTCDVYVIRLASFKKNEAIS
jgi:hypothetical protein